MIPYGNLLYFAVLLYPAAATITLRATRGSAPGWRWMLALSTAMLVLQYWVPLPIGPDAVIRELYLVLAYAALQWGVLRMYLARRSAGKSTREIAIAVLASLAPLAVAKLTPVVAPESLIGFLGISYVTFRALDVLFDAHDGLVKEVAAGPYFAYLFFFPTISAGPIDRFRRFTAELETRRTRADLMHDLDAAAHKLINGLWFKFVLAALVQQYWLAPAAEGSDLASIVSYMYAYSAYLFFDFTGYTDFALATSYLFGVHPPENFRRPYLARNIADFWNRWHISLSHWFRDQIFMRVTMTVMKRRWVASTVSASALAFLVTFGLMGLWHGVALNFALYGLFHAALLAGHTAATRWGRRRAWWGRGRWWPVASWFLTFNLVCFGFLLFSGRLTNS
jgi:membrane protein involved in D-alanine export